MKVVKERNVNLHKEIEARVGMRTAKIKGNILYRVVVFNNNCTQIIDCKDDMIEKSLFANRLKADHITHFAYTMTTHNRRLEAKSDKLRKEAF